MTERSAESEPSMEEILSSIRRIISEGGDAGEKGPSALGARPETQAEILDLTEMVEDDGTVVSLAERTKGKGEAKPAGAAAPPPAEPAPAPPSVAEAEPPPPPVVETRPMPMPPPPPAMKAAPKAPPAAASKDEGLISSDAAQATASALANLASSVSHEAEEGIRVDLGAQGRTLEDIVKELLRPMIQSWLDANLPAITERLVRREIQRIANRVETE